MNEKETEKMNEEAAKTATEEKAAEQPPMSIREKIVTNVYEVASILVTSIVVISIMFTFAIRLVGVIGQSMEPTLSQNDWLITTTSKSSYDFGDIVIIVQPSTLNEPIVKRVIATEGQWVTVDYDEGLVYVGDTKDTMQPLTNETYIAEPANQRRFTDAHEYPIQVPDGCLFVMGDNRNNSTDSRSYVVGFIDERYVLGKSLCRVISGESGFDLSKFSIYDN